MRRQNQATATQQAGFTLIEIMIALALGIVLTSSLLAVFISSQRSYTENDRKARIQSNGRAALYLVANDLRHIGFWGPLIDIDNAEDLPSGALSGTCSAWAGAANVGGDRLIGTSDPANHGVLGGDTCLGSGDVKASTSAVALKRVAQASTPFADLGNGQVFLRAHSQVGSFLVKGSGSGASAASAIWEDRIFQPKIYYVRDYWQTVGDGVPTLCVVQIGTSNQLATTCLVEGVEDMRIEFGIDTSSPSDGVPDEYTASPTATEALSAVAFKLYLLIRDTDQDGSYVNTNTYALGSRSVTVDDSYRRALFSVNVLAQNQRNLPIR